MKKCDLGTQSISSMYVVSINGPRYPKSVTVFAKNIFQKDGGEGHSTFGSVETVVRMTLFSYFYRGPKTILFVYIISQMQENPGTETI